MRVGRSRSASGRFACVSNRLGAWGTGFFTASAVDRNRQRLAPALDGDAPALGLAEQRLQLLHVGDLAPVDLRDDVTGLDTDIARRAAARDLDDDDAARRALEAELLGEGRRQIADRRPGERLAP